MVGTPIAVPVAAAADVDVLELADGVYAYAQRDGSWWINSTGFVTAPGAADVVAIDACATRARTRTLLETIDAVAGAPVSRLVNTHSHPDHTFGNVLFEGATVLAHTRCREDLLQDTLLERPPPVWDPVPSWGVDRLRLPDLTFDTSVDLWVGDRRLVVEFIGGPAHTGGDVVVWLPQERVLFAGDLAFNGGTPLMVSGSVTGYLAALDRLRGYGAEVLVPGHGAPCGPDALDVLERYTRFVVDLAEQAIAAGQDPLEAARQTDLGEFAALSEPERLVPNLHRAYADLGARDGVDIPLAFTEAAALHGGPLPSRL